MSSDTQIFKLQVLDNPLRGLVSILFWGFLLTEIMRCGSSVQNPVSVKGICKHEAACPSLLHTVRSSHKSFPRKSSHLGCVNKNHMTCSTSQAHGDNFLDSGELWLWPSRAIRGVACEKNSRISFANMGFTFSFLALGLLCSCCWNQGCNS